LPGQTAPAMASRLATDVLPLRPSLVVLQTGSADAARSVPVRRPTCGRWPFGVRPFSVISLSLFRLTVSIEPSA